MATYKVFIAYSWDENDKDIMSKIFKILRSKSRRGLQILTADDMIPGSISDKIEDKIDACDITIGIFTRKYESQREGQIFWVPPPFVISETSYAIGSYRKFGSAKQVLAFCEEGVDFRKDIGLLAVTPNQVVKFSRSDFDKYRPAMNDFLNNLVSSLRKGLIFPYIQNSLEKRVTVHGNGQCITENRVRATFINAEKFNGISHFFTGQKRKGGKGLLPKLSEMHGTPLIDRYTKPFFTIKLLEVNGREPEPGWEALFEEEESTPERIKFRLKFSKEVKNGDQVMYQYAWGVPGLYETIKEDLPEGQVNTCWLTTTHGLIDRARLTIRFDTSCKLSKEPFCYVLPTVIDTEPTNLPLDTLPASEVLDTLFFRNFSWELEKFSGTILAQWIPD